MDDWELLRRYAEGSEAAFSDLLRRHVDPVYSTAIRRVRDPEVAQDITQRVFCLLARKASSLDPGGSLIGWLHRTACHVASETLRSERRRRERETEAARLDAMPHESATDDAWKQVAPLLDDALLDLPEPDRLALLLRFFQKLSLRDVGRHLGVSEAAAKMRVGRAVMKMRRILGARGITLTAGALVWLLAEKSVMAAPAGCVSAVTLAVGAAGAGTTVAPLARLLAGLGKWVVPSAAVAGLLWVATVGLVVLTKSSPGRASLDSGVFSELSESNAVALDSVGPEGGMASGSDLADDWRRIELAIERLREVIREPFSRRLPKDRLRDALVPFGRNARAAVPMVMMELREAQKPGVPVEGGFEIRIQCIEVLGMIGPEAQEAIPELVQMLKDGHLDIHSDSAVGLFAGLQPPVDVLRDLVEYLIDPGARPSDWTGNVVAGLLERNPSELPAAIRSLQASLVQLPAERQSQLAHTLARLPGSSPEIVRPILERQLMLPELRDPTYYLSVTVGPATYRTPGQERMFDDVTRRSAVISLATLGTGARDSIPLLEEMAKRTTDILLRDEALRAIGTIEPGQRVVNPEVAAALESWEVDSTLTGLATTGGASPEDLRVGLKRWRSVDAAAAQIATRGESAREFVPDLLDALNQTGSFEAAQALKGLAPEKLVSCLRNPSAFTAEELIEFRVNIAHEALMEAAQALGELGPQGAFALPALYEALEVPDKRWVRITLDKAIHDIDPGAPVSLFTGDSLNAVYGALIDARNAAGQSGNGDRARLAGDTANRIEFNHGMTRKELLAIAGGLQSADPELHAIYSRALWESNPSLRKSLVTSP